MARAVGLDIGSHAVKVVVLDGGPKGAKLVRTAEQAYDVLPGQPITQDIALKAVRAAMSAARAPKQAVSLSIATEQCILREINVPFKQVDQIRKVVKFEFEPHLHSASIEDVVIDFLITGSTRQGSRVLVFACMKEVLGARLEAVKAAGIDPLHAEPGVVSLFNVAKASGAIAAHPNCLIIDIGARTTKALYVNDGELKVARSMRLGSASVQDRVEGDLQGDQDAVRRALESAVGVEALAQPPDAPASTLEIVRSVEAVEAEVARFRQDDFMARVLRETQRTLPTVGQDTAPTHVYLTGGGSRHAHARERIASHFGVEVSDLPVSQAVSHKLPPSEAAQLDATGAVALGTALKVLGMDAAHVDLRQDEFRFARTFDQLRMALATGVTLAFFVIFLMFLGELIALKKAKAEFNSLRATVDQELQVDVFDAYEETVRGARPGKIREEMEFYSPDVKRRLEAIRSHLKNELGLSTEVPPILSAVKSWSTVMQAIKDVRGKVEYLAVTEERYEQKEAKITVVVGDYKDGDAIVQALRKYSDVIGEVRVGAPKARKDGEGIEVPIEMDLLPPSDADDTEKTSSMPSAEPTRTASAEAGAR